MLFASLLAAASASAVLASSGPSTVDPNLATCKLIAAAISSHSAVYYPGSANYTADNNHWVPSSSLNSTCSVEPGTIQDVAAIVEVLAKVNTPFGIKGGGHATSLNTSSTTGVQISMTRFNQIQFDKKSFTITLGMGQVWDKVYDYLEPYNVTASGGRIVGVGVAGFLLGGGYSWLTNHYGLAFDTVLEYNLVLPNGTITTASNTTNPDLFWGLKGGYNNFGIVTTVKVQAYPNTLVYAGVTVYTGASIPLAIQAMAKYTAQQNASPILDGNCLMAYEWVNGTPTLYHSRFYNGPTPPPTLFQAFDGIPYDSTTVAVQQFATYTVENSIDYLNANDWRGTFNSVSVYDITAPLIQSIFDVIDYYTKMLPAGTIVSTNVEPFIKTSVYRPLTDAVWPMEVFAAPLNLYWGWPNESDDALMYSTIEAAAANITATLVAAGQPVDQMVLYPNYAMYNTPVEKLYGPNLNKAKALRAKYDPKGTFLRAGGYKFV